ncbi:hypothetical protein EV714DRAFT_239824 [Schizophyllum commune]
MMAEDKDGRLDQVPPLISIESRFASESVLLPSTIINAANADALCPFVERTGSKSLYIYDNNMPGYQIHEVLSRYARSLALMRNVFRRSCMPTKSSPPLTLIRQDDRRGQLQAATLLSPPADDIDREPRTKMTVCFITRTLNLTTVLVDFKCIVWRFSVSSTPSALYRRSRPGEDGDAAGCRIGRRSAGKIYLPTQARPGAIIVKLNGKTNSRSVRPSDSSVNALEGLSAHQGPDAAIGLTLPMDLDDRPCSLASKISDLWRPDGWPISAWMRNTELEIFGPAGDAGSSQAWIQGPLLSPLSMRTGRQPRPTPNLALL